MRRCAPSETSLVGAATTIRATGVHQASTNNPEFNVDRHLLDNAIALLHHSYCQGNQQGTLHS